MTRIVRYAFFIAVSAALFAAGLCAHAQDKLPRMCRALHKKKFKNMHLKNSPMIFNVESGNDAPHKADMHIMLVDGADSLSRCLADAPEHCVRSLQATCDHMDFHGNVGEQLVITMPHTPEMKHHGENASHDRPTQIALVGLGARVDNMHERIEQMRRAIGQAVRIMEAHRAYEVTIAIPDVDWCSEAGVLAREIASTMMIAGYKFDTYFSQKSLPTKSYSITLRGSPDKHDIISQGISEGFKIGYAVNQARYWSDSPPSVATPRYMAEQAETIARSSNLVCTIFDQHQVKAMGMGGLAAVAQGSTEPCRFIILEYRCASAQAQTLALVGKGVTFDSGGISLKPADRMDEMKHDMAGAAAIMATMELIAEMKPQVNVIALLPFTENMPGGSAMRPGDIVRFYNGVTAEIKNTDAEGRLILADALSYAVKHYRPDAIIDVATLTGSCMQALGKFFAGIMTQHHSLGNRVIESACRSGDRVWVLPLHNDYKPAIRSAVADITNLGAGSYYAGAITAAFFLQHFVANVPWVHLDIAGTTYDVPYSYYGPGSSGFGVRLLIDCIINWPLPVPARGVKEGFYV